MGLSDPSVAIYIAECQRVLKKSGLTYEMHGYGTGLEGEWEQVMNAIRDCHDAVHKMGCPRTDREGASNAAKKQRVVDILQKDESRPA
ncbi:uncharacterized protein L969DRAFT_96107 [Mixia osmundae IAM 14324]|uniref:uncharacterized protein n=1 Tax=Mixia osmundae (strain CBS 9802 / IAM 14324 / JCM 22182 / KY 12970) TaxID=764103 RepID=UPI0004A54CAD|nr:uncharacterized protein L969DRAFT_96107 [Mixia osmundae IAM 14324]KEI37577.1 hypothetical protein L969DRAFT_96107 [Mixia osmundae IAM 14324]